MFSLAQLNVVVVAVNHVGRSTGLINANALTAGTGKLKSAPITTFESTVSSSANQTAANLDLWICISASKYILVPAPWPNPGAIP
jgi:hypothetical protein